MKIIHSAKEMGAWSRQTAGQGKTIGLVPTMGFFHEGHLSLMRLAREKADCLAVSLFVNPIQFGPREDLSRYPRAFDRDCAMAGQEGASVLFAPGVEDMYPPGFQTRVHVDELTSVLCGRERPGHFAGVTTVVAKLFNITRPRYAVFGEKDFQQLVVIRRLARDLNLDVEIIGHPVVREPDGLAMSSRNIYLSPAERRTALCLYHALLHARKRVAAGLQAAAELLAELQEEILSSGGVRIEYMKLVNEEDLADRDVVDRKTRLVMAVKVGTTRLIDNGSLFPGDEEQA